MCRDTLYFMWTIYKTGHCNIQYILYHVCCDNRDSLPGAAAAADDDNDTGDISTCDMQATDDEVAEIFRKQVTW